MTWKTLHIGFDDTDSTRRGCTTYIAALLVEELLKLQAEFIDYPNLIRLNPNVPWKTRGNGALCLRIRCDKNAEGRIKEAVVSTVEEHADLEAKGTDPGVVFLGRSEIPKEVRTHAKNAIGGIVTLKDTTSLLGKLEVEAVGFKKGRGIIGGLAAVGESLRGDHTYEVLAYRTPENWGSERRMDEESILKMDEATAPYTFNNVDPEKRRIIITPRGPDPILYGVRGETPEIVKKAFEIVKPLEPVERWVIFRTNQGTDAHLRKVKSLNQIEPYSSVIASGIVAANPRMIATRHVIFPIRDETAQVDCAAYEPTGALRKAAYELTSGDVIEACGGVKTPSQRHPLTINLEKMRVLKLAPKIACSNPVCPNCGKRLKSMGTNKGFRCEKCGSRHEDATKIQVELRRKIGRSLYVTSNRSQRHLTKPLRRYGMEKRRTAVQRLIRGWHFP